MIDGGGLAAGQERFYDRTGVRLWVFSHLAPYKLHAVVYLLATLGWEVLTSVMALLTGRGFDAVLGDDPDVRGFLIVVVSLLSIVVVRGLFSAVSAYLLDTVANRVEREMREELCLGLLNKDQAFFDRHRIGDLTARATNDASRVNLMLQPGMEFLFIVVFGTVVPLVFIGALRPELLLVPALFVAAFAVAVRAHNRGLGPVSAKVQELFGEMNAHLTETISGMELVESAGQKDHERRRFGENARRYRDASVRQGRVGALYFPPLLLSAALVGALLHGLFLVARGELSVGDVVAYLVLVSMLQGPVETLGASLAMIRSGLSGADRVLEVLNDGAATEGDPGVHRGDMRGEVAFENVTFGYGGAPVLRDVSFRVAPGETVALVGPAGSGKSTLLKLINRTYDPDSGRVLVDGVDLRRWDLDALRPRIAVIEQDVTLFSRSVAENIAFGPVHEADRGEIERAARDARAHDFIAGFEDGYETVIGERGANLSGGQRQRLAIARALLTDPRILMMDDATSAVDGATEEEIQGAIRRVSEGRTTFLITHRLSRIKRADKILVFDRARLVDGGTHEELMARCSLYGRIFAPYG